MTQRGPRHFKPAKTASKSWRDQLDIIDLTDDGRGLARRGGKVVFVSGALAGERVDALSERIGGRYDEAIATRVLVPAPERIQAQCRHYADCGGCQLQHIDERAQHAFKARRFAALVSRLQLDERIIEPPITGQAWHYRHRIRLHFRVNKGQLELGFRAGKSHRISEVSGCQVLRPALTAALQKVYEHKALFQRLHAGMLMLAEAEGGEVRAHLTLEKRPTQAAISEFVSAFPLACSGISVKGEPIWQADTMADGRYPGQSWCFRPEDFSQVNPEVNAAMVSQVCGWLAAQQGDHLMDAFSGLGNFALALAASGASVTGVELDSGMVSRATDNARDWPQLSFLQGDLFSEFYSLPTNINKLVLDPPRAGAAALCRRLAASAVKRVVYVSCDPATLERDARILLSGGYTLRKALWADMFPQSYHMESLCLFERSGIAN